MGMFDFKNSMFGRLMNHSKPEPDAVRVIDDNVQLVHFKISINYCRADNHVYEVDLKESEATVEYYVNYPRYEGFDLVDHIKPVSKVCGGLELKQVLESYIRDYDLISWDGFAGANPPDILDGSSMNFEGILSDGRKISAYGSNNFPKHFNKITNLLNDITSKQVVNDDYYENDYFHFNVPKEWKDIVEISLSEESVLFFIAVNDQNLNLMRVDFSKAGYTGSDNHDRVGRIVKKDSNDLFISVIGYDTDYHYQSTKELMTEAQIAAYQTKEQYDFSKMVQDSIKGVSGGKFEKENFTTLYESDARTLYSKARNIYLCSFNAGDYTSMSDTMIVNGKKYITYSPRYEFDNRIRTIEDYEKLLLSVFCPEIANDWLERKKAANQFIEQNYSLYVDASKNPKSGQFGNNWISDVIQVDESHAKIVVTVQTKQEGDGQYEYSKEEQITYLLSQNPETNTYRFDTFYAWEGSVWPDER